jgi:hypothetical protein
MCELTSIGISKKFMGYRQPNNPQYVAEIHPIMEKVDILILDLIK